MGKKKGWFSVRKPRITIGPKGVKISAPSVRLGKKVGVNVSKRGVTASARTRHGTIHSKNGCSRSIGVLLLPLIGAALATVRALLG